MCGICGVWTADGQLQDRESLERMRDTMINRGPDDSGVSVRPHIALGHRRLSIIDLTSAGRGPFAVDGGRLEIAYNGEIYNFIELRTELRARGHRFRTETDTEVILRGYDQWGTGVLTRLRGMFAFALWDQGRAELLLARDPFGQKPLIYAFEGARLLFASSIRAVLSAMNGVPPIDPAALDDFLSHSYIPSSHSIFRGIHKLPAGHFATVDASGVTVNRYWAPSFTPGRNISFDDAVDAVDAALRVAVRRHLVGDVPVGAFLSGGVDSSTIVAMMAQEHSAAVKTFSIGFREAAYSELEHAREVAVHYKTDHHVRVLDADDVIAALPELVWQYGEPFGDSSAIPTYYVSALARQDVKVALSGDGADELFAGYRYVRGDLTLERYRRFVPRMLRERAAPQAARLIAPRGAHGGWRGSAVTMVEKGRREPGMSHMNWLTWLPYRDELYTAHFAEAIVGHNPLHDYAAFYAAADGRREVDRKLAVDMQLLLADDYLVKVDVASMAASLELRAPFLDIDVVELATHLPLRHKVTMGENKKLLKTVARRYVPSRLLDRPKRGFSIPVAEWMRGPLRSLVERFALGDRALSRGYFNPSVVHRIAVEHFDGRANHSVRLWTLLWLELWHQMFIDKTLERGSTLLRVA